MQAGKNWIYERPSNKKSDNLENDSFLPQSSEQSPGELCGLIWQYRKNGMILSVIKEKNLDEIRIIISGRGFDLKLEQ